MSARIVGIGLLEVLPLLPGPADSLAHGRWTNAEAIRDFNLLLAFRQHGQSTPRAVALSGQELAPVDPERGLREYGLSMWRQRFEE